MDQPNLILKYKRYDEAEPRVVGAARIRIDGRGGLILYSSQSRIPEWISLSGLESLAFQPVGPAGIRSAA